MPFWADLPWDSQTAFSGQAALLIILPLSIISSIIYGKSVSIGDNFLEILLGVLIGGILGALLLKKLNTASLVVSFYFLMAFAGFQMIR